MKDNSLTLDEVNTLVSLLGGVEVVRMILQRTSVEPVAQVEEASQVAVAKRNPKPIPVVMEVCGLSVDGEAPGFIVRCALQRLQECLEAGHDEVFLPRNFFEEKHNEQKPDFTLGRLRNAFTPGQGVGLRELQGKIAEFGYEMEIQRKGLLLQRSEWNTAK